MAEQFSARWSDLLQEVITKPGRLLEAYSAFHDYSLGNQVAALFQCHGRNLSPGPLAPFHTWKQRGRWVRRGEQAIWLCMPITARQRRQQRDDGGDEDGGDDGARRFFVWKPNWFVLAQTDGASYDPPPTPGWDRATALASLGVTEVPFEEVDGNTQGWANGMTIAINPLAELPHKTTFHELGHIALFHTRSVQVSGDRKISEAEAESVALLCLDALGLPGADACRGYVQHWWGTQPIPEASARSIMRAADRILRAGREAEHGEPRG